MVWPLDENKWPSPIHGHNPWLVCEVALNLTLYCKRVHSNEPRTFIPSLMLREIQSSNFGNMKHRKNSSVLCGPHVVNMFDLTYIRGVYGEAIS